MFDQWQLLIFPFDSSSVTITTTVWIGVVITAFFNLRLGWTLSAMVIPGYVVPLMMARPTTAAIILVEAIITYGIALWISESNRMHPYWSSLFGRDRFFLIVIVSVLVRSLCDGWLLPFGGRWLVENLNFNIDFRNDLNSFGLIAVALIANYFWKPGLISGLPCLMTIVMLTWAVVAFLFVPFTNFNIGSFHLLYEDISASMLSSPKAYMVILVTGWLASWINLRYAWDFNGILIPALVALLWTDPSRILVSVFEAGCVLGASKLLISSGLFRNVAIQGGRKLAFFFTVCFLLRFILAHVLSSVAPELKVTDFFGIGYLLSTLIAIKVHDKKASLRMAKGVLQVSVIGAVLACMIGFTFDRLDFFSQSRVSVSSQTVASVGLIESEKSLAELFKEEKIRLYRDRSDLDDVAPTTQQLQLFRDGLFKLKKVSGDLASERNMEALNEIASELAPVNYELLVVQGQDVLLREVEPFRARGWFVVTPTIANGISVIAPDSVKEKWCGESALALHRELDAASVAVFGTAADPSNSSSNNNLCSGFERPFEEVFAAGNGLYVRAEAESSSTNERFDKQNILTVQQSLPKNLELPRLKRFLGGFQFRWDFQPESKTPFWQTSSNTFANQQHSAATIFLTSKTRRRIVARSTIGNENHHPNETNDDLMIKCSLAQWLTTVKDEICSLGSDQYRIPKEEELLFIDEAILQPIFELAAEGKLSAAVIQTLKAIDDEARSVGYRVQLIEDDNTGEQFIALREGFDLENRLGWGTAIFRMGLKEPWGIEVPRPSYERRSFEFGASLFQRPRASLLFVAGAHPHANVDGSSDLSKLANRGNLLNLTRHVLFRELGNRDWLMVQARSIQAPITSDIVVASDGGATEPDSLTGTQKKLCDLFIADGLTIEFVDGRAEVAGYELGIMLRAASVQVTDNKEMMSLWVSPGLRRKFRPQDPLDNLNAQLRACGMESNLTSRKMLIEAAASRNYPPAVPDSLRQQLLVYSIDHDIVKLYSLVHEFDNFQFERFFDDQTKSTLIAIVDVENIVVALFNPRALNEKAIRVEKLDGENLQDFILSRSFLLEVR